MAKTVSNNSTTKAAEALPEGGERILCNGALNLGGHVLYALLQLIVLFVLARCLGKAGLGHYYTMVAIVLVVQLVVEAGMGTLVTQRISQSPNDWRRRVAEATAIFTWISGVSALLILILGGGWYVANGELRCLPAVLGAAVACGAIQWQRFAAAVFQAWELFAFENIAKVLQGVGFICCLSLLAVTNAPDINTVMVVLAISHVVSSTYLLVKLHLHCGGFHWSFTRQLAREWMWLAIPLGSGDVLRKLTWQVDTLVLAFFASPAQVGAYSLAYRPLGPLNWMPRSVLAAAFPSVARQVCLDRASARLAFARSTRLLVVFGLPLAIAMFVAAKPLILLLAGEQFAESVGLFQVLIWVIVLSFVSQQFRFFLTAVNRGHLFASVVAFVLTMKVVLQLVLVPVWGSYGACLGSLLAEATFTALGLLVCINAGIASVEWNLLRRSLIASLLMVGAAWLGYHFNLALLIPWMGLAAGAYVVTCHRLGVFREEEGEYVKQLWSRTAQFITPPSTAIFGNRAP